MKKNSLVILLGIFLLMAAIFVLAGDGLQEIGTGDNNNTIVNGTYNFTATISQSMDNCTLYYAGDDGAFVMIGTDHHGDTPQTAFGISNDTSTVPDGNYTLNFTCGNSSSEGGDGSQISNKSELIYNITIDNTPPTITSFNITDGIRTLTNDTGQFDGTYFLRNISTGINITILINDTKMNMSNYNVTVYYNNTNTASAENGTELIMTTTDDTPPYNFENASLNATLDGANVSVYIYMNDSVGQETNNSGVNVFGTFNFTVDGTAPTPTVSVSPSSVTEEGTITISCSSTDIADPNPAESIVVEYPNGDVALSTSSDSYSFTDTSTVGTYTVTCTANDQINRTNYTTTTFEVTEADGGGNAPSRVGGPSQSTSVSKIAAGGSTTISINNKDIGVSQIKITVIEEATDVKVEIQSHESKPEEATKDLSGKAYKYLTFDTENIQDTNIDSVEIDFEVTKTWLTTNNYRKQEIALFRFTNSNWNKLSTVITDEDDEKVYYTATSEGFSAFAIGVEGVVEEEPETDTGEENTGEGVTESTMNLTWLWIILGVIVIIVVYFVFAQRKK